MRNITVSTVEGDRLETVYTCDDLPIDPKGIKKSLKKKIEYYNLPATFDIEATNINADEPFAFMYHWQFCLGDHVAFGRTWDEFDRLMERLRCGLQLGEHRRLVVYVHNLSYEFAFLCGLHEMTEVFARAVRKPIRAVMDGIIELRCSYFLSNMSLRKFCENSEGCIHYKMSGDLDYRKLRTPSTPLTEAEEGYCYNDVRGLSECIAAALRHDRITRIPLTSTGYVRRDARRAMQTNPKNRFFCRRLRLDPELYQTVRAAFRGGNTHADPSYINDVIDVDCFDLVSSYPAAMMIDKYPMTPFTPAHPSRALMYLNEGYATIGRYHFTGLKFKQLYGIPYIDAGHCRNISGMIKDNGRILMADAFDISLTDIDLKIILRTYEFESISCSALWRAKYDYLPAELRGVVMDYFVKKSQLKGDPEKQYEYVKSKNRLNALFGMMVTDIASPEIVYVNGEWRIETGDLGQKLDAHYRSFSLFSAYQWGVWVTANARARLQQMIDAAAGENGECLIAYTDTDSAKIRGGSGPEIAERLNRLILDQIESAPIPPVCEVGGKTYRMGLWDYEGHAKIKTMGAKKYVTYMDGELEITVAGLNKEIGTMGLIDSAGVEHDGRRIRPEDVQACMDQFHAGKLFDPSGRTTAYYRNDPEHYIEINGERIRTAGCIAIVETTYLLGITDELAGIVQDAQINRKFLSKT